MEAVPRLPMISFDLLTCSNKVAFGGKLRAYIHSFYNEDPDSYTSEIQNLETLRASAVWPGIDVNSCQQMKKYYCQLHFLKSRFPMEENQAACLQFSWKDDYTKMSCTVPDIGFELMCVLFNIGALHSKLGAADSRTTPDGMKLACTHFQCAAWAFQTVRELYPQFVGVVIASSDIVRAMETICLAQAQECILEKSLLDNRKATIVVKVAAELSTFYGQAHKLLAGGDDAMLYEHLPSYKYLVRYIQFKIAHYRCLALLYHGQQAEEQQQMGARVAHYQAALEALQEAHRTIDKMPSSKQAPFKETVTFTLDVVEGKRKAAVNENEFIYHEEVPPAAMALQELKGASLVKGIPFAVNDPEVSGPDIFGRLVPMEAHEASSLYSEQKAQMLRQYGELVSTKDQQLQEYVSALQLDCLQQMKNSKGLTQDLVDRAASMCAKPDAVKDLVDVMAKLSDSYHEVEAMLTEIQEMLKEEESSEKEYQTMMGTRPPSHVVTDLCRETAKYSEAHSKASESNAALHRAMTSHVSNLKVLAQPLALLNAQIPQIQLPDSRVDEKGLAQVEQLMAKVDEMRTQRAQLWTQLRDAVHGDDITGVLVTRDATVGPGGSGSQSLEAVFGREMEKHKKLGAILEQNISAQDNILHALTNTYANFSSSRKYIQDTLNKRSTTIAGLIASHDTYDDLLAKAQKGIEFYTKLETNVSKLAQRVRSTCKVQQEEREQMLLKAGHHAATAAAARHNPAESYQVGSENAEPNSTRKSNAPRLKDYLESRKAATAGEPTHVASGGYNPLTIGQYPPGIRPAPLGADAVVTGTNPGQFDSDSADLVEKMGQLGYYQSGGNLQYPYMTPQGQYGEKSMPYSAGYSNPDGSNKNYNPGYTSTPAATSYSNFAMVNPQKGSFRPVNPTNSSSGQYNPASEQYNPANQSNEQYNPANQTNEQYNPALQTNEQYNAANTPYIPSAAYSPSAAVYNTSSATYSSPAGSNYNTGNSGYNPSNANSSYNISSTPYNPNSTTYNQTGTAYNPANTTYNPNLTYPVNSTTYPNSTLSYNPSSTTYNPNSTTYNPNSTTFNPSSTIYNPDNTTFNPNSTTYNPNSTTYNQSQPISTPYNPVSNIDSTYNPNSTTNQNYPTNTPSSSMISQNTTSNTGSTFPPYNNFTTNQPTATTTSISSYPSASSTYPGYTSNIGYPNFQASQQYISPGASQSPSAGSAMQQYSSFSGSYGSMNFPMSSTFSTCTTSTAQSTADTYKTTQSTYISSAQYKMATDAANAANAAAIAANAGNAIQSHAKVTSVPSTVAEGGSYYGQQSVAGVVGTASYYGYVNPTGVVGYGPYYGQNYQTAVPNTTTVPTITSSSVILPTIPTTKPAQSILPAPEKTPLKISSVDLLAGLDFSVNQAPLVPQKEDSTIPDSLKTNITTSPAKLGLEIIKPVQPMKMLEITKQEQRPKEKPLKREPFKTDSTLKVFTEEAQRFVKYVETLTDNATLEARWKEVQDGQEDSAKKSISVARCYPLKNRSADILPYDYSRVELKNSQDDYINASHVTDLGEYIPDFIVTQLPLKSTVPDFWDMIWEQEVETIVCLLTDIEMGEDIYWPDDQATNLTVANKIISLQHIHTKLNSTERKLMINIPDRKEMKTVTVFQYTSWSGSLIPLSSEPFLAFIKDVLLQYDSQKSHLHPILVHCSSGVGRTGCFCLATSIILEVNAIGAPLPDVIQASTKLSGMRKNILRDREHFKFTYNVIATFYKDIMKVYKKYVPSEESTSSVDVEIKPTIQIDPLSTLDPLWATKRTT